MTAPAIVLVDAGPLVAYYNRNDRWHEAVKDYFETARHLFVTTPPCLTEVMWLLSEDWRVQNEFLIDLARGLYVCEPLLAEDFARVAELNTRYRDMPADFADLSLVVVSERLDISAVASLDRDFDIYRRYGKHPFTRVFPEK
jgi:hypothetical protein